MGGCKNSRNNQQGHNTNDLIGAHKIALETEFIPTGIFYHNPRPCYEETEKETYALGPLVNHELGIKNERAQEIMAEFK